jgi:hypothetical protein
LNLYPPSLPVSADKDPRITALARYALRSFIIHNV